ncbi:MAG TPA: carbohydrate-binding family V/XII [Thermoanaerobaculia bacterium]|nr:carbohydrate-binding family V/XII [Thermoanaerobaculia bacterium]
MKAAVSKFVSGLLLVLFAGVARAAAITPDPWPREFTTPKGNSAVMYQPQFETFKGDTITGRAAISVLKKGETAPKFGVIFFTASVSVDRDDRSVEIRRLKVNRVRFPNITPEKEKKFAGIVESEVPKWNLVISYDRALENVKVAEREKKSAQGLRNEPPKILFAEEPTVLVTLEGEPQLRDVEGAPLKLVVNTALFMVLDTRNNRYYLSGGKKWWYEAPDARGPWRPIGGPPDDIADLATRAAEAQKKSDKDAPADDGTEAANPPKILVSTEPAELIVSEGKPSFKPVAGAGADLLSMENTESDVLLDVPTQNYYVLLSGRWFRSKALSGGVWGYVPPDSLPATFAKIPPDSDAGDIRASVPGTDEAEDAVLDAQIPQTTAVNRADARLDVQYDGEPKFVGIEGTRTEYAVNTPTSVLRIGGRYYACENAVWYVADSPTGPWLLADAVPQDDLEQIPPSAPVYNVKYVQIYDATPDVVYVGYTPGYLGAYPWYGTVVWGTGWYYRPWIGSTYWWPRPCTWGFHAHYTPWSGWGFGSSWSYPFFTVSHGWGGWFRPSGWARPHYWGGGYRGYHRGWFGPGGYRPPTTIVNHYWGNRPGGVRPPGWNRPAGGSGGMHRPLVPGGPVAGRPVVGFRPPARDVGRLRFQNNLYTRVPGPARNLPRTPSFDRSRPASGRPNNVYADTNGEVYRKTKEGWQQRSNNAWRNTGGGTGSVPRTYVRPDGQGSTPRSPAPLARPVVRPAPRPELERDFSARQRGEARVQSWSRPAVPQTRVAPQAHVPQARVAPQARAAPQARVAPSGPAPSGRSDHKKR